ncbi:hypothetical protein [Spirosoma rhododendri]|uniref:Uncharacterized protein n=1 Tax=Spirosoma rhododendri TaxID=2728024 RepID=A0A7L5DWD4_9BACT|nr:hypothetical protein [Spirosoma rhododendri]QJD81653.1 hypothetical protein HH216_25250 [Spirosoma rhododendri]
MVTDLLIDVYGWAKGRIGRPVLLRYQVSKVNGQVPNKVSLLLRELNAVRVNAEIEVEYNPAKRLPYQAVFSLLPFPAESVRPVSLRPSFATQQEVIHWISTGENWV